MLPLAPLEWKAPTHTVKPAAQSAQKNVATPVDSVKKPDAYGGDYYLFRKKYVAIPPPVRKSINQPT